MSRYIASDVLADLGALHYGRKRVQPASRTIRAFYDRAKDLLKFPLLRFHPIEVQAVVDAFKSTTFAERYTCYACAIMPDHVHLLIRKHRDRAEDMIEKLQIASRAAVIDAEMRHFDHPVWGGDGWKVFLESPQDIRRTIGYVEQNPIKSHLAPQKWDFVVPYYGWPFHKRKGRSGRDC